jgi:hypothetical protein
VGEQHRPFLSAASSSESASPEQNKSKKLLQSQQSEKERPNLQLLDCFLHNQSLFLCLHRLPRQKKFVSIFFCWVLKEGAADGELSEERNGQRHILGFFGFRFSEMGGITILMREARRRTQLQMKNLVRRHHRLVVFASSMAFSSCRARPEL